jgi:cell division protein FtsI/penicillin-binding protein 2
MAALNRRARSGLSIGMACAGLLSLIVPPVPAPAQARDLYAQAAAAMLNRSFPSSRVGYLVLDLPTKRILAARWPRIERPIPAGSLLKPFVALAFEDLYTGSSEARTDTSFPTVQCHGRSDGCWRSGGHGLLTLEPALAESCNAYFLDLARTLASDAGMAAMERVIERYGLPAPPELGSASEWDAGRGVARISRMLIGVTPEWRVSPTALALAYASLAENAHRGPVDRVLEGMKLAAGRDGTAAKVGWHPGGVLAKTGTAPCISGGLDGSRRCLANGDGLVVVLAPAESPRLLLLVRERGTTGSRTAEVAGEILARLEAANARAQ